MRPAAVGHPGVCLSFSGKLNGSVGVGKQGQLMQISVETYLVVVRVGGFTLARPSPETRTCCLHEMLDLKFTLEIKTEVIFHIKNVF